MKVANNVRAMVSNEGALIRDTKRGSSFSLNPIGARIWQLLQKGVPTEQIIDRISADFQAPRETVENDVQEFIQNLENQKLIVPEAQAKTAS
jgi:Coenzyme PQQ synthesis protein D (PqqD)